MEGGGGRGGRGGEAAFATVRSMDDEDDDAIIVDNINSNNEEQEDDGDDDDVAPQRRMEPMLKSRRLSYSATNSSSRAPSSRSETPNDADAISSAYFSRQAENNKRNSLLFYLWLPLSLPCGMNILPICSQYHHEPRWVARRYHCDPEQGTVPILRSPYTV
jgi:hypothetical protein